MGGDGGGHLDLVLYSTPATWRGLRASLTWLLHHECGLSDPLPACHSALTWEWVRPILWVNLVAQVTHLTRRKGDSGGRTRSSVWLRPYPCLRRPQQ